MAFEKRSIPNLRKKHGIPVSRSHPILSPGATDTSIFEGRCAFWSYACVGRPSAEFDRISRVAHHYPGKDKWHSKGSVFVVGAYADEEAKSIEGTFQDAIFCHLCPLHIWNSGTRYGRIENITYMRPCAAASFGVGKYNWILHNVLERTDCPKDWLEAARVAVLHWVYIGLDGACPRRLSDVSGKDLTDVFNKDEWDRFVFSPEWREWIPLSDPHGRIWSAALRPGFLFLRKNVP
jgi:hypothetical protein